MLGWLRFAARNVGRNRRRSALTLLALTAGVASMLLLRGLSEGLVGLMLEQIVDGRTGAIQVHRKGYVDSLDVLPTALNLTDDDDTRNLLVAVPGVRAVAGRIRFGGLVSNGASEATFIARAVEPDLEREVCPHFGEDVRQGRPLTGRDHGHAILAVELARALGVQDLSRAPYLALSGTSPEGRANALGAEVTGISALRLPFEDKRSMVMPLSLAQELLGMHGRVTEYGVAVQPDEDVDAVAASLREVLGEGFEVHTWRQLEPYLRDVIRRQRLVLAVIGLVFLLIVLIGVANTMLMSVHERTAEVGTLLAMGVRRREVLWLFALEAGVLGAAGGTLGALLGRVAIAILATTGIHLRLLDTDLVLRPTVELPFVLAAIAVAALGALVSALLPARRASALSPVDALRNA